MSLPTTISTAGLAPGVRFQWISRPAPPGAPRTDIAAFVGIAERGDLHTPTRIESPAQFTSTFGRALPGIYLAYAVDSFFANGGATCWVVRAADPETAATATFNLNYPGGGPAVELRATSPGTWAHRLLVEYVSLGGGRFTLALALPDEGLAEQWRDVSFIRGSTRSIDLVLEGSTLVDAWIFDDEISAATGGASDAARIDLLDAAGQPAVRLELLEPLKWERRVDTTLTPRNAGFDLELSPATEWHAPEHYADLSLDTVVTHLSASAIVKATDARGVAGGRPAPPATGVPFLVAPSPTAAFAGGADGLPLAPVHLSGEDPQQQPPSRFGLATLELIEEISIVAIPEASHLAPPTIPAAPAPVPCEQLTVGPQPSSAPPVSSPAPFDSAQIEGINDAMIRHCTLLEDRVAVLDPPAPDWTVEQVIDWRTKFSSSYAALYFPWLLRTADGGDLLVLPPSGTMAGILARVSRRDGVAKPPANEALTDAAAVAMTVDDLTHGRLNDFSVNAIRTIAGRGIRVLGARTCHADVALSAFLATGQTPSITRDRTPGLRYLNVRRLLAMVESVIKQRLQLFVFERNGPPVWRAIQRTVQTFLDDLWRAGNLDGATAAEAYFVLCDATTNLPFDIDQGRLTCVVGICPVWPAEFVFVRVTATAAGAQIQEGAAAGA